MTEHKHIIAVSEAALNIPMPANAVRVLLGIDKQLYDSGSSEAWINYAEIESAYNIKHETVKNCVELLLAKGIISKSKRGISINEPFIFRIEITK